jgi:hypothetical protein
MGKNLDLPPQLTLEKSTSFVPIGGAGGSFAIPPMPSEYDVGSSITKQMAQQQRQQRK